MRRNVDPQLCVNCHRYPGENPDPGSGRLLCNSCFNALFLRSQSFSVDSSHESRIRDWQIQQRKEELQRNLQRVEEYHSLLSYTAAQVQARLAQFERFTSQLKDDIDRSVAEAQRWYGASLREKYSSFLLGEQSLCPLQFEYAIDPETLKSTIDTLMLYSYERQFPKKCARCSNLVPRFPIPVPPHLDRFKSYAAEVCSLTCLEKYKVNSACPGCFQVISMVQSSMPRYPCGHFFFHNQDCLFASLQRGSSNFHKPCRLACSLCERGFGPEDFGEYLTEQLYFEKVSLIKSTFCCVCESQKLCWPLQCGHWLCANHENPQGLICAFCNVEILHYFNSEESQKIRSSRSQFSLPLGLFRSQSIIGMSPMAMKEVAYPSLHAAKENLRSSAEKSMQLIHPHICTVDDCFLAPNASERAFSVLVKYGLEDAKTKMRGKLDTAGKWKEEELLNWLSSLADALRYAQNKSISHGDIKLEFILFNSSDQPMLFGFEAEASTQVADKDVRDLGVAFAQLATLQTELHAVEEAVESIEYIQLKNVLKAMVGEDSEHRPSFANIMQMCQLPTRLVSNCMMCLQKVVDSEWTLTLPADLQSLPKEQFTTLCSLKCTRKFSLLDKPVVKCAGCQELLKKDDIASSPALSCGHPFHSLECLQNSLKKYIDCPVCSASGAGKTEVDTLLGDEHFESLQADRCTMCLKGQRSKVYGICGHALCQRCTKWSFSSLWRSNCQQCNRTS